jgi:hypothetical protein
MTTRSLIFWTSVGVLLGSISVACSGNFHATSGDGGTGGDASNGSDGGGDDGSANDSGGPCDLVGQTGCSSNQTCFPNTPTQNVCVASGNQPTGSACIHASDCRSGNTCVNGACFQFCSRTNPQCPGPGRCNQAAAKDGQPIPGVGLCEVACDPANPSVACGTCGSFGCASCYLSQPDTNPWFTNCALAAGGRQGETCTLQSCAPGFDCAQSTCQQWCVLASPSCPNGLTCTGFQPAEIINGRGEYGVCH